MYKVKVKNLLTNDIFTATFTSPYLLQDYLRKIKNSKKLKLLWIDYLG